MPQIAAIGLKWISKLVQTSTQKIYRIAFENKVPLGCFLQDYTVGLTPPAVDPTANQAYSDIGTYSSVKPKADGPNCFSASGVFMIGGTSTAMTTTR